MYIVKSPFSLTVEKPKKVSWVLISIELIDDLVS